MCFVWISERTAIVSPLQHEVTGFYNREAITLLPGTNCVFKCTHGDFIYAIFFFFLSFSLRITKASPEMDVFLFSSILYNE
jgi:hypothetical protein